MWLNTRIDYGLRAMLDLALHEGGSAIQNQEISRRQKIPAQYLKQILPSLRRSGLVISSRGPTGGYRLARRPNEVSVAEVIRALDGGSDLLEVAPTARGGESSEVLAELWGELRRSMEGSLEKTTLDDLCRRKRRRDRSLIYHI